MPPTLLFASVAAMIGLHFLLPWARVIPWPWNLAGILPVAFGVVWNLWADQLLKRHRTTVKPGLVPTLLISVGPYRLSRNPMYVGMVAIAAGVAVVLGTLTPMVPPAVFAAVVALKFIPLEEKAMEQAFGAEWNAYKKRVRRWL